MTTAVTLVTGVSGVPVGFNPPTTNSNAVPASTAFVNSALVSNTAWVPFAGVTGGVYNQASLGSGASFVILVSGGVVTSIVAIVNGGTGYVNGDILVINSGNYDAVIRVTNAVAGVIQSAGLAVSYGGTGYTTGITAAGLDIPPGNRTAVFSGVLTSNLTFIITNGTFLTAGRRPCFINNTTGAFTVTVFISNGAGGTTGSGVVLTQGTNNSTAQLVVTDGVTDVWKVA